LIFLVNISNHVLGHVSISHYIKRHVIIFLLKKNIEIRYFLKCQILIFVLIFSCSLIQNLIYFN